MRWSYYVAIVTFAGYLVSKERRRWFVQDWRCSVMMALVPMLGVGILLSRQPSLRQFDRYLEYGKIVAVALFTTAVVNTKERLRVLLWIIALSLGFFGVKSGIWGIYTLGGRAIIRGPGGMLADNNDFSLALSMAVPMLFYLGWTERKPDAETVPQIFIDGQGIGGSDDLGFLRDDTASLAQSHTVDGNPMRFATGPLTIRVDEEWRSRMGERDRAVVSTLTAPLLHRYGYEIRPR